MIKKGHYRGVPIFMDLTTGEVEGRNWFYDILVDINLFIDTEVLQLEELPIWMEVDDDEK